MAEEWGRKERETMEDIEKRRKDRGMLAIVLLP
jgi:hypothetical protein